MEHVSGSDVPGESAAGPRVDSKRGWVAAILGGILATALTWAAGEASVGRFPQKEAGDPQSEAADVAGYNRVLVKNGTLACGLQGAILGLTLGLVSGAAGRPARLATSAGLAGLIVGGVLGAASSFGLFTAFYTLTNSSSPELVASLAMHAGVGALIGAAGGLAFGLGSGGRGLVSRATLGGLAGGILGSVLYEVAGAVLFPMDKTADPVAVSSAARLSWHALVDLLAALGAVAFLDSDARKARGVPRTTEAPAP